MLMIISAALDDPQERDFMARLYEENKKLLFSTALKYAADNHDAEEIVQDSLVRLIGKVEILQAMNRCTLASYIVSTVRNNAINHMRKKSREQGRSAPFDEEWQGESDAPLSMDELLIVAEHHAELAAAWRELSESDRFLLEGKYFLQLSDGELGAALGCKAESIRMKLTRARRNVVKILDRKEAAK